MLAMPVVWSDRHRLHEPGGEIWVGVRTPGTEVPARAERDPRGARRAGRRRASRTTTRRCSPSTTRRWSTTSRSAWEHGRRPASPSPARTGSCPYLFPHPGAAVPPRSRPPAAVSARAGCFAYDTMTLIGPGTWEAARAAVDAALTAADLVRGGRPAAYACCRPPGHHATASAFGGSCYLNNAAVGGRAARGSLRRGRSRSSTSTPTTATAPRRSSTPSRPCSTGSVHVDPGAGWFPHFLGFASERGAGRGKARTCNLPLAPGSGDGPWLEAVAELAGWAGPAAPPASSSRSASTPPAGDPESPLEVTADGYRDAGRALGELGLPTVIVQEGGYDLDDDRPLVLEVLRGVESA